MARNDRSKKRSLAEKSGPPNGNPMPRPDISKMGYNPANFAYRIGTGPWTVDYAVYYAVSFFDARTQQESARSKWWGPMTDPKKLYAGFGLIGIPVDPTGQATARRIWRKFKGQPEGMIHQIPDNITTIYQDDVLYHPTATLTSAQAVLPLRVRHRAEMNCQLVHDSIHRREGWVLTYGLYLGNSAVGYGAVAVAGPWKDRPTVIEFYVLPGYRSRVFALFEAFLDTSRAKYMEVQSNDELLATLLHVYARNVWSEKIVFRDQLTTALSANGAVLRCVTPEEETRRAIEARQGGTEWQLLRQDTTVATGGILYHYNHPYADIYMEVAEPFRHRGFGAYLVQELKRVAYELGCIPCARCNPTNMASRRTLQKAGFAPCGHILNGTISNHREPLPFSDEMRP
ncbi:MAG: GNAT family N-acetyltransferase [Candidatus Latescibacteria bacterium]|nr:GNAT family N-acetyltransferase [Candidatus Latescibacterota bacterium]